MSWISSRLPTWIGRGAASAAAEVTASKSLNRFLLWLTPFLAIVKKGEKYKGLPGKTPMVTPGRSGPSAGPGELDRNATTTAAEEARDSKEFDSVFRDLTIGGRAPEKAAEPILRCRFHPGRVAYRASQTRIPLPPGDLELT